MSVSHPLLLFLLLPIPLALIHSSAFSGFAARNLPGDWGRIIQWAPGVATASLNLRGRRSYPLALPAAIWGSISLALAGIGFPAESDTRHGNLAGRVLVLDIGSSVEVSALRIVASELLDHAPDIPTAIVASTGIAFDVVPLTTDRAHQDRYLEVIDPAIMPVSGRSLDRATRHAEGILARASIIVGQVIIITGNQPPATSGKSAGDWSRWFLLPDGETGAWDDFATKQNARIAGFTGSGMSVDDLLDRIENLVRANRLGLFDLTPWFVTIAGFCWLGLFRKTVEA